MGGEAKKPMFVNLITKLAGEKSVDRIALRKWAVPETIPEEVWFPKHVSELDSCAHVVVKYEPTEDPKHPVRLVRRLKCSIRLGVWGR